MWLVISNHVESSTWEVLVVVVLESKPNTTRFCHRYSHTKKKIENKLLRFPEWYRETQSSTLLLALACLMLSKCVIQIPRGCNWVKLSLRLQLDCDWMPPVPSSPPPMSQRAAHVTEPNDLDVTLVHVKPHKRTSSVCVCWNVCHQCCSLATLIFRSENYNPTHTYYSPPPLTARIQLLAFRLQNIIVSKQTAYFSW